MRGSDWGMFNSILLMMDSLTDIAKDIKDTDTRNRVTEILTEAVEKMECCKE